MPVKYSIKETKELLDLGFGLAKAGKDALADGKVTLWDLPLIVPVLGLVSPGIEGGELVPKELGDLDEAESKELLDYAKSKIPDIVSDADLKKKVYSCLKAGLALLEAISVLRG